MAFMIRGRIVSIVLAMLFAAATVALGEEVAPLTPALGEAEKEDHAASSDEALAKQALDAARKELGSGRGDPAKIEKLFNSLPAGAQNLIASTEGAKEKAHWWWWYRYRYHRGSRGSRGSRGGWGTRGWGGPTGYLGPRGATGARGPRGPTNRKGYQGPIGRPGPKGYPGTVGIPGVRGRRGDQGVIGVRGPPGPNYVLGSRGPSGPRGDAGVPGIRGVRGPVGPGGDGGPRGAQGRMGRRGDGPGKESGPPGVKGHRGEHGMMGPEGLAGPEGDPNPQPGVRGDMGAKGALGPAGPPGPRGVIGEKGRPMTHLKGVRGAEGLNGPRGFAGPLGVVGPKGINGPTGPRGRQGATGGVGIRGPRGVRGLVGADGPDGDSGRPGRAGVRGPKGDIGPLGLRGPRGSRGVAGPNGEQGGKGAVGAHGKQGPRGKTGRIGVQGVIGKVGPDGRRGRLGRRGVDGEPGAPGPRGRHGRTGEAGYRGDLGAEGSAGVAGIAGEPGTAGAKGPVGAVGDRGLAGADSPGPSFARFMSGEWLDKHAIFHTEARARVFQNGMIKFSRGRRKHEKLFGLQLAAPGALHADRHYTVKLRVAAADLSARNSLFVGVSDSKYLGGFLRTESGDGALGRIMVDHESSGNVRYEVVHDTNEAWGIDSGGETGWRERKDSDAKKPITLDQARAQGLIRESPAAEAEAEKVDSRVASADGIAAAAEAALATDSSITASTGSRGQRSLLGGDDGDDATVTTSEMYGDKLREAIHQSSDFGGPDEAKVRGGAPLVGKSGNEHVAREWLADDGDEQKTMDGTPAWKLPHTGWLSRGKLRNYSPRWFEVYIRFDTAERTAVLARTNSQYVPVLADLPFKMDPTKGVNLAVFAADPAEEYGIFAIDAHIIEETP